MNKAVTISRANNYIRVFDYKEKFVDEVLMPFCRLHLFKWEDVPDPKTGQIVKKVGNVFARFNHDRTEFRIAIGLLPGLLEVMERMHYPEGCVDFITEKEISPKPLGEGVKFKEGWGIPRDYQEEWVEYQRDDGHPLKVINGRTGFGKTFCALYQIVTGKEKTIIIVQPRYVSVWVKAFVEQLDFFLEDVLVLDNNNIEELHTSVSKGIVNPSIYIIPQTKIQMYLKKMKTDSSLPCLDEVFDDMGIGFRIYDEAHEAFHQVYMSLLFGNVKKTSLLSATMKSDDSFTNKMYDIVAPKEIYLKGTEETQYIETYAYHYRIDQRKFFIGHKGFGGNYNDIMFEKSMFRNKVTTKFYLDLILKAFNEYYYERREEGTKCLLFFTKTDTCERVKNFLLKEYPDLDVISFTGLMTKKKDMKDEYLKHEVVVTTPGSCGTGKDIPGLITTVCSHSVSSRQRNIQMIGRLRPTDKVFPHLPPQFVYLVCDDIPKQRDYHRKRKELFHSKSVKQENVNSQMYLN